MWTLVIMLLNVTPPAGLTVTGFRDEAACIVEAKRICAGEPRYVCRCRFIMPKEVET
jgi:hypothetical protein